MEEGSRGLGCDKYTHVHACWQLHHTCALTSYRHPHDVQVQIALKAAAEGDEAAVVAFLDSGGGVNAKTKTGAR